MKTCTKCGEAKPLSDFYDRNARCKSCHKMVENERYYLKKEYVLEKMRQPEARELQRARDRERNKDPKRKQQQLESSRRWRENNADKRKDVCAKWNSKPKSKALNARRVARRRAQQHKATPPWADHATIDFFYTSMTYLRQDGLDVHVDHIIPLFGKTVCGLHTHNNLQLMFADLNHSKSNKFN